jgi:hypothetical protein
MGLCARTNHTGTEEEVNRKFPLESCAALKKRNFQWGLLTGREGREGEMTEDEKALELAVIAPELSHSQINELCSGRRYEDYRKAKIRRLLRQAECAIRRQTQTHERFRQVETKFVDGPGQHMAQIDEFLYHAMRIMYGGDCWRDKDKREFIYRKFPFLRLPAPKPRFIPVNGFRHKEPSTFTRIGNLLMNAKSNESAGRATFGKEEIAT